MSLESKPHHVSPHKTLAEADEKSQIDSEAHFEEQPPPKDLRGIKRAVLMVAILSSTFLYAFDNTVMATIRPSIIRDLGHVEMLAWMSVSYPLGEVGGGPIWGKLYDQLNNKWLFLFAVLLFEVGSAVIGSASTVEILVVGRVMSGLGGSGIYVGTIAIISALTTLTERAQYLGYFGMAWGFGTILGPIVGGAIADSAATWRWAFYINICVAGIFAPICLLMIPNLRKIDASALQRLRRFDYVGALLFLSGVLTINMILTLGGTIYLWTNIALKILYAICPAVWVAFIIQQRLSLFAVERIFPCEFMKRISIVNLGSWTALAISNLVVVVYTLPLLFQFAFGDSSLRAALYILPYMLTIVLSAGIGGALLPKYPIYKFWYIGCAIMMLIGSTLLSTVNAHTSRGAICGFSVIQGLGCGAVAQLGFTVAQSKVTKENIQRVTTFISTVQMGALCLSLGISTCIFMNTTTTDIAHLLPDVPRAAVQAALSGVSGETFLQTLTGTARDEVISIIARNLSHVFYMNVAGAAFGIVTALAMKKESVAFDKHTQ